MPSRRRSCAPSRKSTAFPLARTMDKAVIPPSGDKHDYMSQAPYWWADPSKPRGLPYVRKDGQRNPEVDKITDHAEFERLAKTSFSLALAFGVIGNLVNL